MPDSPSIDTLWIISIGIERISNTINKPLIGKPERPPNDVNTGVIDKG